MKSELPTKKAPDHAARGNTIDDHASSKVNDTFAKIYQINHRTATGTKIEAVGVEGYWYCTKGIKTFPCIDPACKTCFRPSQDNFDVNDPKNRTTYFNNVRPRPLSNDNILKRTERTSVSVAQCSGAFGRVFFGPPLSTFNPKRQWLAKAHDRPTLDPHTDIVYVPEDRKTVPLEGYTFDNGGAGGEDEGSCRGLVRGSERQLQFQERKAAEASRQPFRQPYHRQRPRHRSSRTSIDSASPSSPPW